jgi:farnesyl diphosphate synthase
MEELLREFEEFLNKNIPTKKSFHPHFEEAMKKMFKAGGKRFRPLLLLSVVEAYEPLLLKNAFYPALAVEMIHTYSLIHDDLPTFDDAPLRRGEETLHITYDEVTATLVGDALNTEAFGIIAKAPLDSDIKIKLIKELVDGSGVNGMVLGQAIDCFFENKKLSLDELKFLHTHKTATLIASSLKMGAIVCDLSKEEVAIFEELGLKIGLLFQIQDDIIDATKSSKEVGKPTNSDGSKNSFTNLLGVDGAIKAKDELKARIEEFFSKVDKKLQIRLRKMMDKYL